MLERVSSFILQVLFEQLFKITRLIEIGETDD